jgi:hypothetical protein
MKLPLDDVTILYIIYRRQFWQCECLQVTNLAIHSKYIKCVATTNVTASHKI